MKKKIMTTDEKFAFKNIVRDISAWSKEHQLEIGAVEVAVGAAVLTYGVNNGLIELGRDLLGTNTSNWSMNGAGAGGTIGMATAFIGSIGVAGMGTAIGIPALALTGGATILLGAFGYTVGDLLHEYLHPGYDFSDIFSGALTLTVGVSLLIDGTRRIIGDKRLQDQFSHLKNGVMYLANISSDVVARTPKELSAWLNELRSLPNSKLDAFGSIATAAIFTTQGIGIASTAASSSLAVMGSQTLGGAALSLGLISAPVWPVVAGATGSFVLGYTVWKTGGYIWDKVAHRNHESITQ